MIITLEEAQKLDRDITIEDLEGLEVAIRELTHNNFQNINGGMLRFSVKELVEPNLIKLFSTPQGLRMGDRIEVANTVYNQYLNTVKSITSEGIEVEGEPFIHEKNSNLFVTLVRYPADVKMGVKKLIEYDKKTSGNIGIKSRSISRVSETYFDVTSGENVNGYPSSLFDFITKYKRMSWGK